MNCLGEKFDLILEVDLQKTFENITIWEGEKKYTQDKFEGNPKAFNNFIEESGELMDLWIID